MAYEQFKQRWTLNAVQAMEASEATRLMQSKSLHKLAKKALKTMLAPRTPLTQTQAAVFVGTYCALNASEQLIENNGNCRGQVHYFVDTAKTVINAFESGDKVVFQSNFSSLFVAYEVYREVTAKFGVLDYEMLDEEHQVDIDNRLRADVNEAHSALEAAMSLEGPEADKFEVFATLAQSNPALQRLLGEWQFLLGPPSH